jgi:Chromosome segregation protein Spc25
MYPFVLFRLSFTQINQSSPNQRYSFEIGLRDEKWSIENVHPIPLPTSTVQQCEQLFNDTDDMMGLANSMRSAFFAQLTFDNNSLI